MTPGHSNDQHRLCLKCQRGLLPTDSYPGRSSFSDSVTTYTMLSDGPTLDEEINKCLLHLAKLRTRKNALSPINRLPSEVLAMIFIYWASDYYHESPAGRVENVPSWVNVSYVCHQWRNVALNCPTLWSYHFVLSTHWTDELLARSKQAPLKIRIKGSELLERLAGHSERIQDLHLDLWSTYKLNIPAEFSLCSHRLQRLAISLPDDSEFQFPSTFLDVEGTTLRELDLTRCPMPWYSFTLSGLTRLQLSHVPPHFQKGTKEFLSILGSMKGLTHLCIDDALAITQDIPSIDSSDGPSLKISLPRLHHLLVGAPSSIIIALLSCISIPVEAELRFRLSFNGRHAPLEEDHALFLLLAHRFQVSTGPSFPMFRCMVIQSESGSGGGVALAFGSSRYDDKRRLDETHWDDVEWGCKIPLKIILVDASSSWWNRGRDDPIINDICRLLPLEDLQSLHVYNYSLSLKCWLETIGRFQGLQDIKLSRCETDISSALYYTRDSESDTDGDADEDPAEVHIVAPDLEYLELCEMTLSNWGEPPTEGEGAEPDLETLSRALSAREALCTVTVTRCCLRYEGGNEKDDDRSLTFTAGNGRYY